MHGNMNVKYTATCFDTFVSSSVYNQSLAKLPKLIYDMIYLLTATGLTPGGSSTVHIYT